MADLLIKSHGEGVEIIERWHDNGDGTYSRTTYGAGTAQGSAGTPTGGVQSVQGVTGGTPIAASTTPGANAVTIATLQSAAVATGNGTPIDVSGMATLVAAVSGTFVGTITWEASLDDTTWTSLLGELLSTSAGTLQTTTTTAVSLRFNVTGYKSVRARISAYTSGSITVIGRAQANEGPLPQTNVALYSVGSTSPAAVNTPTDGQTSQIGLVTFSQNDAFNGATWDRLRNNNDLTLLTSAARTATIASTSQTNYNGRAVRVDIDVTAAAGSPSLVFALQVGDALSSAWTTVLSSAPITGISHTVLHYGLSVVAVANLAAGGVLGRLFRVVCTAGTADSVTYSVSASVNL